MQETDVLEFTCPCCSSSLGLDEAGELYTITDNLPGKKGVNGIRTHNVSGDNWTQQRYLQSEPQMYEAPSAMIAGKAGKQETVSAPEILKANQADLKQRNLSN